MERKRRKGEKEKQRKETFEKYGKGSEKTINGETKEKKRKEKVARERIRNEK